MVGALLRFARWRVAPVVAPRSLQYPVHEDDLAAVVVALADAQNLPSGPLGVANPTPVAFRTLLTTLIGASGRSCHLVPIPWRVIYGALRLAELLPIRPPFRADSLLGLVRSAPLVPNVDRLVELGVRLRPFPAPGAATHLLPPDDNATLTS